MSVRLNGFTLAEVLITLGIIGIVAAMTLPAIIHKKTTKELEAAFKKATANLYNSFNLVIADGYPVYDGTNGDSDFDSEFSRQIYKKYKKLRKITRSKNLEYWKVAKNFTKNNTMGVPQCSQYMSSAGAFIAPDGSVISVVQNCGAAWFTIDTNGIKKGPNALGHDIFIFMAKRDTDKLIPANSESEVACDDEGECGYNNTAETKNKCSNTSKSDINGATCAVYAMSNTCPWDESKTYWECLP